ncbi:zinc finger protein 182-like [Anopheles ziemanni]|uniref:zinc finger protein 182-like n=1 Tax=Anopheles coustani TaxID=139045 RepID=UPI00265B0981|nr:zinc finger protein 182-like [Anopheles coustani]XP_058177422.1 zinc finger protein 182-like [Anopheles ziemanni]
MGKANLIERVDSICRLCLEEDGIVPIFDHENIDIPSVVKFVTQLEISNYDAFTKVVCVSCCKFLESVVEFKERCIQSYQTLLELQQESAHVDSKEFATLHSNQDFPLEFIECVPPQTKTIHETAEDADDGEQLDTRSYSETDTYASKDRLETEDDEKSKISKRGSLRKRSIEPEPGQESSTSTNPCPLCGEHIAGGKIMVKHHIKSDHGDDGTLPKIRQCFFCPKAYSSFQLLKFHLNFHPQKVWQCPQCDKCFRNKGIFIDHLRRHANERHFECKICGKRFTTNNYLSTHRQLHKMQDVRNSKVNRSTYSGRKQGRKEAVHDDQTFLCSICPDRFNLQMQLNMHLQCDHVPQDNSEHRYYKCTVCSKPYVNMQLLNIHRQLHELDESCTKTESNEKNTQDVSAVFLCVYCGREFLAERYFKRHLQSHTSDKPQQKPEIYECEICGQQMKTKSNYTNHRKSHRDISATHTKNQQPGETSSDDVEHKKMFLCNICGHNCGSSSNLTVHLRRHNGQTICECLLCGKGYPRRSDLIMHMRTHTGEKPFVCTSCGKGFSRRDKLRIHIRTHTGEKPYGCPCGRAYAQKNDLKTHQKRNNCGQNFDMSKLLAPYPSSICIKSPARSKSVSPSNLLPNVQDSLPENVKDEAELLVSGGAGVDLIDTPNWDQYMSGTFCKQENVTDISFSSQPKLYS